MDHFVRGWIALDLPAPLNKPIDLGEIEVPIPSSKQALDFGTKAAAGAADSEEGSACASSSSSSSGGSSSGGSSSGGSADGGTDARDGGDGSADAAAPATKVSVKVDGQALTVTSTNVWGEVSGTGEYDLFIRVTGPGVPAGSDIHISATETGTYCTNSTNYIAYRPQGDTRYMPGSPSGSICGLDIVSLPTNVGGRLTGSFVGTLRSINTFPARTKKLEVYFDALRDK